MSTRKRHRRPLTPDQIAFERSALRTYSEFLSAAPPDDPRPARTRAGYPKTPDGKPGRKPRAQHAAPKQVSFRVTPDEYAQLLERAARSGLTISDLVRIQLELGPAPKTTPCKDKK